jgi:hypothetical protein
MLEALRLRMDFVPRVAQRTDEVRLDDAMPSEGAEGGAPAG